MATHPTKKRILFNANAPGLFPTWAPSAMVGGETENVDCGPVGRRNPGRRVGSAEDGGAVAAS